jgi:predicted membrane protein
VVPLDVASNPPAVLFCASVHRLLPTSLFGCNRVVALFGLVLMLPLMLLMLLLLLLVLAGHSAQRRGTRPSQAGVSFLRHVATGTLCMQVWECRESS